MCVHKNKESAIRFILILFSLLLIIFIMPISSAQADDDIHKSATEYDYPPFSVTSEGVADGFSVELLEAVCKEVGISVSFKIDTWATIKQELQDGVLDMLPLVGYNEERDKVYDFTVPYIIMHGNIFIREGSDISTEEDLIGKEIIVMRGDNMHEFALEKNYTDKLILTDTYTQAFKLLAEGKHDAVLSQNLVGQIIIDELNLQDVKSAETLTINENVEILTSTNLEGFEQKFCFAVKEGDSELLAKLNEGLAIASANGTFNKLYNKWFPFIAESELTLKEKISSSAIIIVPYIFVLLLVAVFLTWIQIKKKKSELEKSNNALLMLEAHLIQKQKLESIGTLASGVAHEINNPINGILNYSQLINDISSEEDDDYLDSKNEIIKFSREIMNETQRISNIVSNLLQFSRTEKKSHSKADVHTIVDGVLSLISVLINRNEIILEVNLRDKIYPIICRSQQIQQILVNLITNGKDALNDKYPRYDDNKKIIITAGNILINGKDYVRISVQDHGTGIPHDVSANIFDPFFTTKDRSEGTGLGLSISYSIAQEHNGNLSFESKKGEYTRFHLDLPAAGME